MAAMLRRAHVIDERHEFVSDARVGRLVKQEAIQVQIASELDVLRHLPAHQSETLQLDAEDDGRSLDREFLGGRHFALAFLAFVRIVAFQSFATEVVT